jgi:hypothetical protein
VRYVVIDEGCAGDPIPKCWSRARWSQRGCFLLVNLTGSFRHFFRQTKPKLICAELELYGKTWADPAN